MILTYYDYKNKASGDESPGVRVLVPVLILTNTHTHTLRAKGKKSHNKGHPPYYIIGAVLPGISLSPEGGHPSEVTA